MTHCVEHGVLVKRISVFSVNKDGGIDNIFCPIWAATKVKSDVPVCPTLCPVRHVSNHVFHVHLASSPVSNLGSLSPRQVACASLSRQQEFIRVMVMGVGDVVEVTEEILHGAVPVDGNTINVRGGLLITKHSVRPVRNVRSLVVQHHDLDVRMVSFDNRPQRFPHEFRLLFCRHDQILPLRCVQRIANRLIGDGKTPEIDTLILVSIEELRDVLGVCH
mmetsp:Transcript_23795/g.60088  ORF Transcript_23795/g.60088 Transcript_23795/m.60088 type:complete len:219 (+) Transcript_23795:390-1046(+)